MAFKFGQRSMQNLSGVHPDLVRVAQHAISISAVDFTVIEGLRTLERQRQLLASGASQTLRSRHLTGHAIDVAPWVPGRGIVWEPEELFTQIAEAFRKAAIRERVPVVWGRAWLNNLTHYKSAQEAMDVYVAERRRQGRRPFLDGPHFELPRVLYPDPTR